MNERTQKLTFGAMLIAIFGVLLVLNRQTGGLFEELFFFILPIPMTVFSLKYGWKDSLSVFVCMSVLSFFLGTLYTVFFAVTDAMLGIVMGTCLKNKVDPTRTQLLVIILSAIFSVLSSVTLASVLGVDINMQITEVQSMMENMLRRNGIDSSAAADVLSYASLKRLFIFSMVLLGAMQGFIIFRLSLLILKKLRLPVPQPQPIGLYYPPRWTGYAALFLYFLYIYSTSRPFGNEPVQAALQIVGLCGYLFLLCFGWIAVSMLIRGLVSGTAGRLLAFAAAFLCIFVIPFVILILGFLYVSGNLHRQLLKP